MKQIIAASEAELDAAFDAYDGCPTAQEDLRKHGLTRESETSNRTYSVRLFWRTQSGTGSTEFSYQCANYSEAFAKARAEFRTFFSGYTLTATSIV